MAHGITSFKCFLVYKKEGMMVDDATLVRVMRRAKEVGAIPHLHAENPDLMDLNIEQFQAEGKTSAWYHYLSRPEAVEAEADKRAVHLATYVNAPLYLVHMADKEGLETALAAKRAGHDIFVETCPQYLAFTSDVYKREDGRNFVCSPPIKGQESQDALWEAIRNGSLDVVATDHCPFQSHEKDWGKDDFTKIPNGCAGVENLYPYMLSAANEGRISFSRAVALCATNPARIFGCDTKGSLTVGKDADIVVYDPERDFTISVANMHSDYDHTIWEGTTLHGYPIQTYVRGQLVYDNAPLLAHLALAGMSPARHGTGGTYESGLLLAEMAGSCLLASRLPVPPPVRTNCPSTRSSVLSGLKTWTARAIYCPRRSPAQPVRTSPVFPPVSRDASTSRFPSKISSAARGHVPRPGCSTVVPPERISPLNSAV